MYFCGHTIKVDGGMPIPIFPSRSPQYTLSAASSSGSQEEKATIVFEAWDSIVFDYCELDLSESADKLPAISALADAIGMTLTAIFSTPALYRAGLWLQQMPLNLLWHLDIGHTNDQSRSKYRAPSWSWASVDGKIGTPDHGTLAAYHPACYTAHVLQCETQLASNTAPYGQVLSGELQINGLIKEIPRYYVNSTHSDVKAREICLEDRNYNIKEDCYLDSLDVDWIDSDRSEANHIIAVLCIVRLPRSEEELNFAEQKRVSGFSWCDTIWGLVLRRRAEDKAYSRIGLFVAAERWTPLPDENLLRWQESFERKTITIV
jgi:hypothetical protein